MPASNWFPQQLAAFLEAIWSARTEAAVALMAVERAAEALDAEIAAIVAGDHVVAVVGYPEGAVPAGELVLIAAAGGRRAAIVPGAGECRVATVSLDYPPGATLLLARAGADGGLSHDEASLLRGMARVTSMAMRTQRLLDDERRAREESERQAAENARLLAELSVRQARLTELAGEQAALRRVATLVATGTASGEVFKAVTIEMRSLLDADIASLLHYEADATATILAASSDPDTELPSLSRLTLDGTSVAATVHRTGRAARIDRLDGPPGSVAAAFGGLGMSSAAGAPIIVEGSLWGGLVAYWRDPQAVPPDTEGRIAQFTQLVATAISNAASRAQLAASRARLVATGDETRRRIERDLHDGIQQRLVTLILEMRTAGEPVPPPDHASLLAAVAHAHQELNRILDELREISRGVHPAILSHSGLAPALRWLARRSSVPATLDLGTFGRLPQPVEAAAYYVASEALTNAAKHANASAVHVALDVKDSTLRLSIEDDGDGGADPARGSGIIGLIDRVDAMGGKLTLRSPPGEGTSLVIELPL